MVEIELFLHELLNRVWFIDELGKLILAVLWGGLFYLIIKTGYRHLKEVTSAIISEYKDGKNLNPTVGAINFFCVLTISIIGVVIIIAVESKEIIEFIAEHIGKSQSKIAASGANLLTILYVVAPVMVISILAVTIEKRNR